ncbi:unnamed protein product, partial [Rotaria sp. Silwood1]
MPALLILTLSIRDTSDHRFCHGLTMESMLNQYAIHLPAPLINSISSQPFIRHLIIQRRLTDETEIPILAQQYPNVRYLQLLFPLEKSAFLHCFKTLFSYDDDTYEKFYFWPEL